MSSIISQLIKPRGRVYYRKWESIRLGPKYYKWLRNMDSDTIHVISYTSSFQPYNSDEPGQTFVFAEEILSLPRQNGTISTREQHE